MVDKKHRNREYETHPRSLGSEVLSWRFWIPTRILDKLFIYRMETWNLHILFYTEITAIGEVSFFTKKCQIFGVLAFLPFYSLPSFCSSLPSPSCSFFSCSPFLVSASLNWIFANSFHPWASVCYLCPPWALPWTLLPPCPLCLLSSSSSCERACGICSPSTPLHIGTWQNRHRHSLHDCCLSTWLCLSLPQLPTQVQLCLRLDPPGRILPN